MTKNNNEQLNEDQLIIIKKKKIKAEPITENSLEELYGTTVMTVDIIPNIPSAPADPHIDEIIHNERKYLFANDKFVTMTKGYFGNMISEIEKLKRIVREHDRELTKLKSRIESLSNRRNGVN